MTDAPEESQEPGAPKEPQYKEVSETELKRVLAEHEKWLQTDGEEGAQAKLQGANLRVAKLQRADLRGAKLQKANLYRADLQSAILRVADLQGANLGVANLQGAKLLGANLSGANLYGANLSGAKLTEAEHLTQQQLDEACGDKETKLPEGLTIETCPEDK